MAGDQGGAEREHAADYDPTGTTAAMHHLTTVAAGGTYDPAAQEHFAAGEPMGHAPGSGSIDVDHTGAVGGGFAGHVDPAMATHQDPMHQDPMHHDPTGGMDAMHHDPTGGMDALHHDPTGGMDALRHDPAGAPAPAPPMPEHSYDDPNAHAAMPADVPQHDASTPFADPGAGMQHDAPVYETHEEPAPAYTNPDDDQY